MSEDHGKRKRPPPRFLLPRKWFAISVIGAGAIVATVAWLPTQQGQAFWSLLCLTQRESRGPHGIETYHVRRFGDPDERHGPFLRRPAPGSTIVKAVGRYENGAIHGVVETHYSHGRVVFVMWEQGKPVRLVEEP